MFKKIIFATTLMFLPVVYATEIQSETSTPVQAAKDIPEEATYAMCENKDYVRTLRIETKKNGGCLTHYSKDGSEQVIGESWNLAKCREFFHNVAQNLQEANWKCRDISKSQITTIKSNGG